jgi:hypothetical protein
MYFLPETGQPLRLNYAKGRYGPYADNLNHVLQALEGHYLRGYGNRTQRVLDLSPITLTDGAADDARQWLKANADDAAAGRIADVTRKERLFTEHHVHVATEHLRALSWLGAQKNSPRRPGPQCLM